MNSQKVMILFNIKELNYATNLPLSWNKEYIKSLFVGKNPFNDKDYQSLLCIGIKIIDNLKSY